MKLAVTSHAVKRYQERVEGAEVFDDESVRKIIHDLVCEAWGTGAVRPHPTISDRRIIPFQSGRSILYFSVGPNTTSFEADVAVIGVLFEKDLTQGKVGTGATIGDVVKGVTVVPVLSRPPRFIVLVGEEDSIEVVRLVDEEKLQQWLANRGAADAAHVYELKSPP